MTVHIPFDNSFARLPEGFAAHVSPEPVRAPESDRPRRADPYAHLSNSDLRIQAKAHRKDTAKALGMWRSLIERDLPPQEKAEALLQSGHVYRQLGEWDAAIASFRTAGETAGLATPKGQLAVYQLGWALTSNGDVRAALVEMDRVIAEPNATGPMRTSARLAAAGFAKATGDVERARREWERLVADFEDHEEAWYRSIAKTAADRLSELR